MESILITGVSGFLGWKLALGLRSQYQLYGTYLKHAVSMAGVETLPFDLRDLQEIPRLCGRIRPQMIIHTAALSDPDYCELHQEEATRINVAATRQLAESASSLDSRLIFTSTDLVFDGKAGMYVETDSPNPLNHYARTKLEGERHIASTCRRHAILRLSLLYGRGTGRNHNFLDRMQEQAVANSPLHLFVDQFRTPLFVDDVVVAIERINADESLHGLFHLGGPERMNRFQFGEVFCRVFRFSSRLLVPTRLSEAHLKAPRPKDCSLRSDKARDLLKLTPKDVESGLRQIHMLATENRHHSHLL